MDMTVSTMKRCYGSARREPQGLDSDGQCTFLLDRGFAAELGAFASEFLRNRPFIRPMRFGSGVRTRWRRDCQGGRLGLLAAAVVAVIVAARRERRHAARHLQRFADRTADRHRQPRRQNHPHRATRSTPTRKLTGLAKLFSNARGASSGPGRSSTAAFRRPLSRRSPPTPT